MGLNQLLGTIKKTAVGIQFLKTRVPERCGVMEYSALKGKTRRELFEKFDSIIVLIPKKGQDIGHFICLIAKRNHLEYFSSLGNSWETEMRLLQEPTDIFRKLLGKNYIYNRTPLQNEENYKIQDCAAFCIARVYLRQMKLREFIKLFDRYVLKTPDDVVSMLVLLLFTNKKHS